MKIRIAAIAAMTTLMTGAAFAAPVSPLFNGYESYNREERLGWYSLQPNGDTSFIWSDASAATGVPMSSGWRRDGKLCGIYSLFVDNVLYALDYVELNEETGEVILQRQIEADATNRINYYHTASYIPEKDRVYGYGWSADGNSYVFKSSNYDITETSVIRTIPNDEICASLTYCEDTGLLVGFNRKSFVTIDPETGRQTNVFTPENLNYQYTYSALGYDPESGKYYWNMVSKDGVAHLYLVDLNRKTCTLIKDYDNLTIFSFLVPANPDGDPQAPAKPEFESADFGEGNLSGTVTFRLPSDKLNGEALSGNLEWEASIDANIVESGEAAAGSNITFTATNLTEGIHNFTVRAKSGDKSSRQGSWTGFVGHDTPAAPADVDLQERALTWKAVTIGANGGYVNPSEITYTIYLNGKQQGTTKSNSFTVTYPEGAEFTTYQASVTASYDGKISEAGVSQTVKTGAPLSLPVDLTPTAAQSELFQFGGSGDWKYDASESGKENFRTQATEGEALDSWIFMPPLSTPDADGVYEVSIRTALSDVDLADGEFEVMAGTAPTPEAMTTTVITPLTLTSPSIKEFKGLFSPASLDGAKCVYIGIRAKSESGNFGIYARRFIVRPTDMKATVASAPVMQSVEAMPEGELKAKVSFTFPSTLMNGDPIPAGTKLQALIECDMNRTTIDGTPGSQATGEVKTLQGSNYLTVTSMLDGKKGNYGRIRVYTGMALPSSVENLNVDIADDNMTCDITWDAPAKAIGEGYLNPADISYYYCIKGNDGEYTPAVNLNKSTSYNLSAPSPVKLTNVDFAIQSRTNAGSSPDLVGTRVQLGRPYALPMTEIFYDSRTEKPKLSYSPYTFITAGPYAGTAWEVKDPATVDEKYAHEFPIALICNGSEGSTGYFLFPKFSTKDMTESGMEITLYGEETTPNLYLWGTAPGQNEPVAIGSIEKYQINSYKTYSFKFPESLQNKGWVSVYITPEFNKEGRLVISDFSIETKVGVRITSLDEPDSTVAGGKGEIYLNGNSEASVYTLDGAMVWSGDVDGEKRIRLNPAIYIVTLGGKTFKTIVK